MILFGNQGQAILTHRLVELPPHARFAIEHLLEQLKMLDEQIAEFENRMREVFMAPDGESMLARMVEVFSGFWSQERLVLRKIRAIAAIEPDFGQAVKARDQRRHQIAERVVERLFALQEGLTQEERSRKIAALVALTSFEFFDAFADSCGDADRAKAGMIPVIRRAMGAPQSAGEHHRPPNL